MSRWRALVLAMALTTTSAPAAEPGRNVAVTANADWAGHYFPSGPHEVGPDLLLRPDGTFEWMLAYGALDQLASGRWQREGDGIVLQADATPARQVFAMQPMRAWSAADGGRDGIGVRVGDPRTGRHFARIGVVFSFDDGTTIEADTDDDGYAATPRGKAKLQRIVLSLPDPQFPAETFAVTAKGDGVFEFHVDSQGLKPPAPFQRMPLRIDGRDLVPTWPDGREQGRYSRD